MIRYEYECRNCGRFEYAQSIKDEALTKCPHCGAECKRVISKEMPTVWWIGWPFLKEDGLL